MSHYYNKYNVSYRDTTVITEEIEAQNENAAREILEKKGKEVVSVELTSPLKKYFVHWAFIQSGHSEIMAHSKSEAKDLYEEDHCKWPEQLHDASPDYVTYVEELKEDEE